MTRLPRLAAGLAARLNRVIPPLAAGVVAALLLTPTAVAQGPPRLVPVSGTLNDATGQPRTGVVTLTLALYAASAGGDPLWLEQQAVDLSATGRFSVELGATTGGVPVEVFATGPARWLAIRVGDEAEPVRVELLSVPYAVAASDAAMLAGSPASDFARTDTVTETVREKVAADTDRADGKPSEGALVTTNQISKFTSTGGALDDSAVTDAGGFIGVGTTTPNYLFQLHSPGSHSLFQWSNATTGSAAADGTWMGLLAGDPTFRIINQEAASMSFHTNGVRQVTLDATGRVGVGISGPNYPLHLDARSGHSLFQLTNTTTGSAPADGSYFGVLGVDKTFRIANQENANIELFTNGLRRMTINSTGAVGIGGSRSPSVPLELHAATGDALIRFTNPTTGALATDGSYIGVQEGSHTLRIVNLEEASIEFHVEGQRRMTITQTGNLEINMGNSNIGIGSQALDSLVGSTPTSNTAVGRNALTANMVGGGNSALGAEALSGNNFGTANTAIGYAALLASVGGHENVALGGHALWQMNGGSYNTALGREALMIMGNALENQRNVAIGHRAGIDLLAGAGNTYIGHAGATSESSVLRIGTSGFQTQAFVAGIFGTTTGVDDAITVVIDSNGQLGTIPSSRRFKDDIRDMGEASAGLSRLRPVTFIYTQPYADGSKPLDYGLIAEEVADVYPDLVVRDAVGRPETVQYHKLVPMLLHRLQQQEAALEAGTRATLARGRTLQEQAAEIEVQQALLDALSSQVDALEHGDGPENAGAAFPGRRSPEGEGVRRPGIAGLTTREEHWSAPNGGAK
jgi:hypothetical protein